MTQNLEQKSEEVNKTEKRTDVCGGYTRILGCASLALMIAGAAAICYQYPNQSELSERSLAWGIGFGLAYIVMKL